MKITDLKVWVTKPEANGRSFVFLRIDTDEGISGIGEATSSGGGGSIVVGNMARFLRDSTVTTDFRTSLIGQDPENIDRIWHELYRRFTGGGGSGGFVTTLLSGIDIALWDIKGKVMGRPIYELFAGPIWDNIPLYTHVAPGDPDKAAAQARSLAAEGYTALKT
ncbi:MAG: mandelate racemase/muconate lactonizing enzyme family protein, partial [SAR202 cluster bacterium]|nr:mandelate racemase/muconate lactonizing enzyme family protein [SAR202 cluster bacterium]